MVWTGCTTPFIFWRLIPVFGFVYVFCGPLDHIGNIGNRVHQMHHVGLIFLVFGPIACDVSKIIQWHWLAKTIAMWRFWLTSVTMSLRLSAGLAEVTNCLKGSSFVFFSSSQLISTRHQNSYILNLPENWRSLSFYLFIHTSMRKLILVERSLSVEAVWISCRRPNSKFSD